jgi:hypothetical protein
MKRIFYFLIAFTGILFTSCDEEKDPTIFVKYNWTAGLEYYTDNISVTYKAGTAAARDYQGPVAAGAYTYTYKLTSENTTRTGSILLASPPRKPDSENKRKYMIGIYNNNMEITFIDE